MFQRRGLLRNKIVSDDGFAIEFGTSILMYHEAGRTMSVTIERTLQNFAVYADTISRWDDDPMHSVSEQEKQRIYDNIRRALQSQDFRVSTT